MTAAVSIKNLSKDFPIQARGMKLRAVDRLSLEVPEKAIFGLLGPNGSGKSTTIKALLGLIESTEGECLIFGQAVGTPQSRQRVGYLPEAPYFYKFMTGLEMVSHFGRLGGLAKKKSIAISMQLLDRVGIADAANRRIGGYSKGMLQRLGLAQALVNDPDLLILDEPMAGVDPLGAADMARLIHEFNQEGKTIILCSHLLAKVERICDRVAILNKGKLIAEGTVDDLLIGRTSFLKMSGLSQSEMQRIMDTTFQEGAKVEMLHEQVSLEALFLKRIKEDSERR